MSVPLTRLSPSFRQSPFVLATRITPLPIPYWGSLGLDSGLLEKLGSECTREVETQAVCNMYELRLEE
jgi:hypothetical protein